MIELLSKILLQGIWFGIVCWGIWRNGGQCICMEVATGGSNNHWSVKQCTINKTSDLDVTRCAVWVARLMASYDLKGDLSFINAMNQKLPEGS